MPCRWYLGWSDVSRNVCEDVRGPETSWDKRTDTNKGRICGSTVALRGYVHDVRDTAGRTKLWDKECARLDRLHEEERRKGDGGEDEVREEVK
jgi:hypothetical protein